MTNHPRRQRPDITAENDRDLAAAEALAGQLVPAEPGDIPPQGSAEIPAHTGNGVPPGLKANAAKIIGKAVADALAETLPPLLAQSGRFCGPCLANRLNWEIAHEADLKAAVEQMMIAAQVMPPDDPRRAQLNPFMFLPPHLLPSADPQNPHPDAVPEPAAWITMTGGTLYCIQHLPGVTRPGDAQKRPFFIASAPLSAGLLAEIKGERPAA